MRDLFLLQGGEIPDQCSDQKGQASQVSKDNLVEQVNFLVQRNGYKSDEGRKIGCNQDGKEDIGRVNCT